MNPVNKVLHIELGKHLVGGTMQAFYLASRLQERGIDNLVVTPKNSPLQQLLDEACVPTLPIEFKGDVDLRLVGIIKAAVLDFAPDVVHIHSRRGADTLGLLGARLAVRELKRKHKTQAKTPKIIVSRRVDDPLKRTWFNRLRFEKLPDHVICVSKGIKKVMVDAGFDASMISQTYSAIEFSKYQHSGDVTAIKASLGIKNQHVIAVIGQLIPRKGQHFLIDAMPQILAAHPDTCLVLLGEGEERERLEQQIVRLNLTDHVMLLGYRKNVGEILSVIDVLVHPATMEGFANVAMQALAAQVPVVSSNVGGMPEIVLENQAGLLVEHSQPDQLATAVIKLLSDPEQRAQFGAAGKAHVESNFTVEKSVDSILRTYASLFK